jgi:hypothetical protein
VKASYRGLALWIFFACATTTAAAPPTLNGFALEPSLISSSEIQRGGPPRDGIPALDQPIVLTAAESSWGDEEIVVGVVRSGKARAYPLSVLVWHELVNDVLGGDPILVSYCPLCATALVFDRRLDGRVRNFGVSGLLYRSDLLMFDRETESLWSQIAARAVTGDFLGRRLELLRSKIVPWKIWKDLHPKTTILSPQTGHNRDYGNPPYGDYMASKRLAFPVQFDSSRHPKLPTLGLRFPDGPSRAYPSDEVVRAGGRVEENFSELPVVIRYDAKAQTFDYDVPSEIEVVEGFWFAWMAFHPESSVFISPALD